MIETVENNIFIKYLEIKQDLINNLREVWRRRNYYKQKYRGNLHTDILVGVDDTEDGNKILLIFIRNNGKWIRDELVFNSKTIISSHITNNFSNE